MPETKKQLLHFSQTGFTLIELLVVIAIIGLLSSILMVSMVNSRENARRVTALESQKQLQKAVEMYNLDVGFYPPDVNRGWDPGISKPLPYNKDLGFDCNVDASQCACPGTNMSAPCPPAN
jgi:prepilin-type N-terminal cleavage/methylation domain-containing protein